MRKLGVPLIITWIVIVVIAVVFALIGVNAFNDITNNRNAIATLQTNVTTLQNGLNSANSNISALQTKVNSNSADIASLKSSLGADETKLATLSGQLSSAQSQLTTLSGQLTTDEAQLATLQSALSTANSQIAALQTQVTTLSSTVATLQAGGAGGTQLAAAQTITATGGQTQQYVTAFTASYTGYITITGYSTTSTGYLWTVNSTYGSSSQYAFGTTSTTVTIPVQPGTLYLYFGNSAASGTAVYVYITSPIYYYHY